jgi:hypothetical protein
MNAAKNDKDTTSIDTSSKKKMNKQEKKLLKKRLQMQKELEERDL